jgi:hypothetical protein
MRTDQSQGFTAGYLLPPASYNADNTPATFDVGTADSCTILLQVGVGGITFSGVNKIEFVLTHSDDDSTFTAVADADVVGSVVAAGGIVRALTAAHAAPSVTVLGYVGRKRYLRLLADFSGTHGTATPLSAAAVRGNLPVIAPAATV